MMETEIMDEIRSVFKRPFSVMINFHLKSFNRVVGNLSV